jgi:hypothetical protein
MFHGELSAAANKYWCVFSGWWQSLTPVLKLSVLKQRLFLLVSITSTNDGSHPFIKLANDIFTNHMNILLDKGSKFIENYMVIGDLNYDILTPDKSQVLDDIFISLESCK